jgi:hypothetical protein
MVEYEEESLSTGRGLWRVWTVCGRHNGNGVWKDKMLNA